MQQESSGAALSRAVEYLSAAQVAPDAYAYKAGTKWYILPGYLLKIEARCLRGEPNIPMGAIDALAGKRVQIKATWWTPERPFAIFTTGKRPRLVMTAVRSTGLAVHSTRERLVTVSIETGEEIAA